MKIVFIITGLSTGGAERMLQKLLEKMDREQFRPEVISLTDMGEIGPRIQMLGIPVISLGMRKSFPNPFLILRLIKLLRQMRPDIVSTWMYHADFLGGVAARIAGCPAVVWGLRNSDLSREYTAGTTLLIAKACAWLSRWLPKRILSCSVRAKSVHIALGYRADAFHIIPNGFDLSRFSPDISARRSLRAELGLHSDAPLVGLIARYDPQKNHAGFVTAAAHINALRPDVQFVLAGSGVDVHNDTLWAAISSKGLNGKFHLLGLRDDVPRLMAALDVLASTSSFGEAFPNVVGEAMACGVPCVVTDVGDCAAIVAETGLVSRVDDMLGFARNILDLLQMPAPERVALGARGRMRVQENYEIGAVAEQYQAFFRQVASKSAVGNF